ncbi:carboxypeptidase B [Agrilus planipennis]|uniref:Carboxypeptidase B n=1 Tax=Agrilus planipennis TaxID=224129 RepID=A0A1W4XSM1_AGRPL|nr:carboxypeptidase B [Agrilus planipennis]
MKGLTVAVFGLCVALAASRFTYNGYQIVVIETNEEQAKLLHENWELDYVTPLPKYGGITKVIVKPEEQVEFYQFLEREQIKFTVTVDDLERHFEEERLELEKNSRDSDRSISFTKYHRYAEINRYLRSLASEHPNLVSLQTIGQSYEGRNLTVIKISSGGSANKPVILVDAGIHAREWIAPATALYIINQLVENSANRHLIQNVDWYILPVLNPDGYEYTHTNTRLWRKTRCAGRRCYGTDGNRNFDFHWGVTGASSSECSETYRGPSAFSEIELQGFRNFARANANRIKLYLTLHSYGNYILYPWGYTSALPSDSAELQALGDSVASRIRTYSGSRFTVGSSTNVLYAAAGGSDDWMKGVNGVELSYTLELQGDRSGFELPASRILSSVRETFVGIRVFHDYVEEKFA